MSSWPRMQFRFYGVSKWTGKLEGDATEIQDLYKWAASRGIDTSGVHPVGIRPTPISVEHMYEHAATYLRQEEVDKFFS